MPFSKTHLFIYFIVINIVLFLLMGLDKKWAQTQKGRISEKTLILIAFLGGAIGGLAGMLFYRHKTSKKKIYYYFTIFTLFYIFLWTFVL